MQETVNNHELVSALADGQLRGEEFAHTLELLGQGHEARLTWHTYHLVGDVLRSGGAVASARDVAFVQRLKLSLQQEVPLVAGFSATDSVAEVADLTAVGGIKRSERAAANESRFGWKLLAGVASLAAVSVIGWQGMGGWGAQPGSPQLAQLPVQTIPAELALPLATADGEPQRMIRDPQLDALLAAHRQFGGTSALQMPAGFLRNATFEGAAR